MKLRTRVIAVSVLLGLFAGTIDTIVDYIFFYEGETFLDLMIFDVPKREIYIRLMILLSFIIFGLVVGSIISRLQEALENIKTLSGFLPICSKCKKIRDDKGYWSQVEEYISDHSEAEFSHSICEECSEKLYGELDWYNKYKKVKNNGQDT